MALAQRLSRYGEFARFVAKYGRVELAPNGDARNIRSHQARLNGEQFANDVEALGPTFIKLGQLLSTRTEWLPAEYVSALERLQDAAEPFPFPDAVQILEEDLGVRFSKAFTRFEEAPVAAASLGQVYRAVLRNGRAVAVKVQRPHALEQVTEDLETLDQLAPLLDRVPAVSRNIDIPRLLGEFRHTMLRELDYEQESRNLTALHRQLRDIDRIVVPCPIEDYTSRRVLTMDYIAGTKITKVAGVEWTEVDGAALADDLFRAYLQQILVDGLFHADPHPGNVLLTPDGRLGLIDLGMVGRLPASIQEQLFKLMLAVADGRGEEAATAAIALGEEREDFNETQLRHVTTQLVGRFQDAKANELNIGSVFLNLARAGHQHGLRMAVELPLLGKTLLNLHHIGLTLAPEFDINQSMRHHATSIMRRRTLRTMTPTHLLSGLLEARDFVDRLPQRLNRVFDALSSNDLRLKVELIDHGAIIDGLQKVANRIALGVVLAALILGAAQLMQVPTRFTILGYPGIAMLLFLGAAAGGVWLAWTILASDVKRVRGR